MNFPILMVNKPFSDDAITDQLHRIFGHPDFSKSEILKKFLSYIVHETLMGNAGFLKEYTIALNVLERPANFNPQSDCIVRIHAGRLRTALSHYYHGMGINDQLIIGIPKGKYVPAFTHRQQWNDEKKVTRVKNESISSFFYEEPVTFAILPFFSTKESKLIKAFNDNLCLQISSGLSQVSHASVIAYQALKNMTAKQLDLKELGASVGFNHIITGGTQYAKNKIRINVQIIDTRTYKQIWSGIFESKLSTTHLFEIQDDISRQTVLQAQKLIVNN